MSVKRYYWDFFGPRADGTAQHFAKHLREFLSHNELSDCEVGVESQGAGHAAAVCTAPAAAQPTIEGALKPKRTSSDGA